MPVLPQSRRAATRVFTLFDAQPCLASAMQLIAVPTLPTNTCPSHDRMTPTQGAIGQLGDLSASCQGPFAAEEVPRAVSTNPQHVYWLTAALCVTGPRLGGELQHRMPSKHTSALERFAKCPTISTFLPRP